MICPGLLPAGAAAVPFPAPAPGAGTLAGEAWAGRAYRLAHPAGSIRTIGQGLAELGGARPPRRLPRTSLNRPTGPRRRLDVITADLAACGSCDNLAIFNGGIVVLIGTYAWFHAMPWNEIIPLLLTSVLASIPVALPATFTLAAALGARALAEGRRFANSAHGPRRSCHHQRPMLG